MNCDVTVRWLVARAERGGYFGFFLFSQVALRSDSIAEVRR